jgi:hypothetical protein
MDPNTPSSVQTPLLMAHRTHDGETEAEAVLVEHEDNVVVLKLDDGDELRMDRTELRRRLDDGHSQAA